MDAESYSITELANRVNDWCQRQAIQPLHNGAGLKVTVRNIRYYQSSGLVDRPSHLNGRGFSEKHRLQLVAIRVLQAKGLPLGKIQGMLCGRTEEALREIQRRGLSELELSPDSMPHPAGPDWKITPINSDILVLTRSGHEITPAQRFKIQEILSAGSMATRESVELESTIGESTGLESFRPETD